MYSSPDVTQFIVFKAGQLHLLEKVGDVEGRPQRGMRNRNAQNTTIAIDYEGYTEAGGPLRRIRVYTGNERREVQILDSDPNEFTNPAIS